MTATTETRKATVSCAKCSRLNRVDLARLESRPACGVCGNPLQLDKPLMVTDATFDRVVSDAEVPLLVDFYADWCGPCKAMAPHIDGLAAAHAGRALIAKLDTEQNPGIARRYDIRGIPTLIVFRGGREVAREVGAVPRPALESLLDRAYRA